MYVVIPLQFCYKCYGIIIIVCRLVSLKQLNTLTLKEVFIFSFIYIHPFIYSFMHACILSFTHTFIYTFLTIRGIQDDPFRGAYGQIGNLRGFVRCPVLCLTATAGIKTRREIMKSLHMRNVKVVKLSPDKPNCKFIVAKAVGDIEEQFKSMVEELREKQQSFPKTIVYCRSIASCGEMFSLFSEELEGMSDGMYAMYHSKTPQTIQEKVLDSLGEKDGLVRIVFATNALGMGVNIPNIRRVVHYGIPRDTEEYIQEVGRGGRDKEKFEAIMLYKSFQLAACDDEIKSYVRNPSNQCRRKSIMRFFKERCNSPSLGHDCCDICTKACDCGNEEMHKNSLELEKSATGGSNPPLSRSVNDEERAFLKEVLVGHLSSNPHASFLGMNVLVDSLDHETVDSIVDNCQYIFSIDYLLDNFPILSHALAHEILIVVNEVFEDIEEAVQCSKIQLEEFDSDDLILNVPDWCTEFNISNSEHSESSKEDHL